MTEPDSPPSLTGPTAGAASLEQLRVRLDGVMRRDRDRLARRLDTLARGRRNAAPVPAAELAEAARQIESSERRAARRRASLPSPSYPGDLPITGRKDDILAAIRDHQVVIVAGETGSGKSTQLPKMCLDLGRGVLGMIGHTQPRRLAARTVAERIAEELGTEIGAGVGYTVRFTDRAGDDTFVKVMTDGILLAELQRDRLLTHYDTIIVDEAHERSLNIDFILGYLKQLLPRRPDLKVIVTSATIDTERFSQHFDNAPVVEVSGRTYPVEIRYRPLVETGDEGGEDDETVAAAGRGVERVRDQTQAVCDAVEELCDEGPGDILVFLSGEREIRDTADALQRMELRDTELVPLYARLSAAEQHRVFQPHRGRRVVLATNVAETSLTVPGIRYVVDAGTARLSRYNRRTKVQRLPIEPISQASANQRAGRCGRVAAGICIRLYGEADFEARPEFTEAEILRTNLASVILQMAAIGLGDVAAFPFVDPPDARNIKDGLALLDELGALVADQPGGLTRLTPLGRTLAKLPLDPRLARMVIEADRHGCTREVMVIAAALSIQDPRERPADKQEAAAQLHARFADKDSDFISYLRLWEYLREQQRALSSSQFRRLCRNEMLNYLRVREWQDVFSQLRQLAGTVGVTVQSEPGDRDAIHASILAGLLSHIGMHDPSKGDYLGARNARFAIARGSALFRKSPRWVMAAELVETNRLWGRVAARIEPEWAERLAPHLVRRTYGEITWSPTRGTASVVERVTLYGLPIVTGRNIAYSKVDRAAARDLFIERALVEGDWRTHHAFVRDNETLVEEVRALEDRVRRRDLLVDEDALFDFFDERIPQDVTSGRHFDRWWKDARRRQPDLLTFTRAMLVNAAVGEVTIDAYPDEWRQDDLALPLTYQLDPGADDDGVTVHVPLALLNQVSSEGFDWQVPGLREELVVAMLRSLPKPVRRHFIPASDVARAFLAVAEPERGPLLDALANHLARHTGIRVPAGAWDLDRVPPYLRITFSVEDDEGKVLAAGKDLDALRVRLGASMRRAIAGAAGAAGEPIETTGLRSWSIGTLPRVVEADRAGHVVRAYPALIDEGETVGVRVFASEAEQARAMRAGTRRLVLLSIPSPTRALQRLLTTQTKLALAHSRYESVGALLKDCIAAAVDRLVDAAGGPAWDAEGFARVLDAVRDDVVDEVLSTVNETGRVLAAARALETRLAGLTASVLSPAIADIDFQMGRLLRPGFVSAAGPARLPDILRYLRAIDVRLDKLGGDPARDQDRMRRVQRLEQELVELRASVPPDRTTDDVDEIGWMIEELRVNFFAQAVGTPRPVSEQRIVKAMDRLCE